MPILEPSLVSVVPAAEVDAMVAAIQADLDALERERAAAEAAALAAEQRAGSDGSDLEYLEWTIENLEGFAKHLRDAHEEELEGIRARAERRAIALVERAQAEADLIVSYARAMAGSDWRPAPIPFAAVRFGSLDAPPRPAVAPAPPAPPPPASPPPAPHVFAPAAGAESPPPVAPDPPIVVVAPPVVVTDPPVVVTAPPFVAPVAEPVPEATPVADAPVVPAPVVVAEVAGDDPMLPVMWRADPTPGGTTAVPARPAPAVIDAQSAVVKAFVDAPPDPVEDAVVVPPPPAAIPEAPPPTQAPYSPAPSPPVAQPVEEPAATGFWSEPAEPALKRFVHNVPVFAVVQVLFVIVALIIVLIWIG